LSSVALSGRSESFLELATAVSKAAFRSAMVLFLEVGE
jgi:hypothetical protein